MLTDSEQDLEVGVAVFEGHHALVEADLAVHRFVVGLQRAQFAFLHPSERVNDMRAEVRVDIFRKIFARFRPVLGPVGEIADDLVALVRIARHWPVVVVVG